MQPCPHSFVRCMQRYGAELCMQTYAACQHRPHCSLFRLISVPIHTALPRVLIYAACNATARSYASLHAMVRSYGFWHRNIMLPSASDFVYCTLQYVASPSLYQTRPPSCRCTCPSSFAPRTTSDPTSSTTFLDKCLLFSYLAILPASSPLI